MSGRGGRDEGEVRGMILRLTVNGEPHEIDDVGAGESLLTVLRDGLHLTGTKNACEQGECGSCAVYLDGGLVCSCLVLAGQAAGQDVVTVEGLAASGELHPVQDGVRAGRRGPVRLLHPGTGAGRSRPAPPGARPLRPADPGGTGGQPVPVHRVPEDHQRGSPGREGPAGTARPGGPMTTTTESRVRGKVRGGVRGGVGESAVRVDAVPKVTGTFDYASDLWADGMLWGATLRSPHPHARIRRIDAAAAACAARRSRRPARGRPGGQADVRAELRRSAGPGGRPGPLPRGAGRHRRRRHAGDRAPGHDAHRRRLGAACGGDRHGGRAAARGAAVARHRQRAAARAHHPRRPGRRRGRMCGSTATTKPACRTRRRWARKPGWRYPRRTGASTCSWRPSGCTWTRNRSRPA